MQEQKYVCKSIANTMTGSTDSGEKMRDWVVPEGGAEEEEHDEKEEEHDEKEEEENDEKVKKVSQNLQRRQITLQNLNVLDIMDW